MKYQKFKRYIFNSLSKNISFLWEEIHSFMLYLLRYLGRLLKKTYSKVLNYNYYNFLKYLKNVGYKFFRYLKSYIRLNKIKNYIAYSSAFIILNIFVYINIPFFFNYDQSIVKKYCSTFEIQCLVDGKIKYTFFPSPRIKFKNLKILDSDKKILASINNVAIKIAINRLANQDKFSFTNIEIKDSEINFYYDDLMKYKKMVNKIIFINPLIFKKSNINFFDGNQKKITSIKESNIKVKSLNDVIIKGIFLNDEIQINYEKNTKNEKRLIFKLLQSNILAKINIFEKKEDKKPIKGDLLFKKGKNRARSIFTYENNQIFFEDADIRNEILNGNLVGYVKFLPFFDFDLDLALKGFNFKRFYTYLSKLNKEEINKLVKINYKINGNLNLSTDKIYSKHDLIDSFESNIKFSNGNILVDKFLLNLGKLGAADVTGTIKTDKKYTNFKFESNVYIDNKKYFTRKFSIYSDKKIFNNLFASGTLDLVNFKMLFNEIVGDSKLREDEILYLEKEFNYYMLDNGIISFFDFNKFKEFIKTAISD